MTYDDCSFIAGRVKIYDTGKVHFSELILALSAACLERVSELCSQ